MCQYDQYSVTGQKFENHNGYFSEENLEIGKNILDLSATVCKNNTNIFWETERILNVKAKGINFFRRSNKTVYLLDKDIFYR